MLEVLKRRLEINPGETTQDGKYDLERVFCLGCCALAPWSPLTIRPMPRCRFETAGILDEHKKA